MGGVRLFAPRGAGLSLHHPDRASSRYPAPMSARGGTGLLPGAAPAVVRAVSVLDALAASPDGVMSLSDLSRARRPEYRRVPSTALELGGMIRRDDAAAVGRRLVELGGAYLTGMDQVREFGLCARPRSFTTDAPAPCRRRRHARPRPTRATCDQVHRDIGDRFPASITAGQGALADLYDHEIERLYRRSRVAA